MVQKCSAGQGTKRLCLSQEILWGSFPINGSTSLAFFTLLHACFPPEHRCTSRSTARSHRTRMRTGCWATAWSAVCTRELCPSPSRGPSWAFTARCVSSGRMDTRFLPIVCSCVFLYPCVGACRPPSQMIWGKAFAPHWRGSTRSRDAPEPKPSPLLYSAHIFRRTLRSWMWCLTCPSSAARPWAAFAPTARARR